MMNVKILGTVLGVVLLVCGLYFGIRIVHQGNVPPVLEVEEAPVQTVEVPVSKVADPVSTVELPGPEVEAPVSEIEAPVPTIEPSAPMPAEDSDFVGEDVTYDSVSATVDDVVPLVRPPDPPLGGLEYALKDVPEEAVEEVYMAYLTKYYPLLLREDEVNQFDERTREEYDRQMALYVKDTHYIEEDMRELEQTLRDVFASIPLEMLEISSQDVPKELLDFLRKEGFIE